MALITIDPTALSAADRTRATRQFGRYLQLKDGNGVLRPATAAEIKADLVKYFRWVVETNEAAEAHEAVATPTFNAD